MSFDVVFQTCHLSDKTEETLNPFTGKTMRRVVGETATDAERDAMARLLVDVGAVGPDEHGCYVVTLSDDSSFELYFEHLRGETEFSGGMAVLGELTGPLSDFLFDLASHGNLAMLPAMEGDVTVVTSEAAAASVSSRWPNAVVMNDGDALNVLLGKGVDAWKQYRDQVTR
jgi:hypothetical protein